MTPFLMLYTGLFDQKQRVSVCRLRYRKSPEYFDVLLTVHLSIIISVINQLDAQNFSFTVSLFHVSTCFKVKIVLHSLWYHHTETSEWSKITKIQLYKSEQIVKFM